MSTILRIESFAPQNLRERGQLRDSVDAGADSMRLVSSAGFVPGAVIYIGKLGVEGCERSQVASVAADGHVGLSAPLKGAHGAYSDVTAVRRRMELC